MALPVRGVSGLSDVVAALRPDGVVIAGGHVGDDDVARWAYRVRSAAGPLPMALFRRGSQDRHVRTTGTRPLLDAPFGAHRQIFALIDDRSAAPAPGVAVLPAHAARRRVGA
jgi:hypothetical protein